MQFAIFILVETLVFSRIEYCLVYSISILAISVLVLVAANQMAEIVGFILVVLFLVCASSPSMHFKSESCKTFPLTREGESFSI